MYSPLASGIKINARRVNSVSSPERETPTLLPFQPTHLETLYKIRSKEREKKKRVQEDRKTCSVSPLSICSPSWEKTRAIHQAPRCCLHVFNSLKGHAVKTPILAVPSNRPNLRAKLIYIQLRRVWVDICICASFISL